MHQKKLNPNSQKRQPTRKRRATSNIKVGSKTFTDFKKLLTRVNQKDLGSEISADDIIDLILSKFTEDDVKSLQANSLSNADRLEIMFRDYVAKNGEISKDDFIGRVILDLPVDLPNQNSDED